MEQTEKTFEQQVQELNLNISEHAMIRYKERVRNDLTGVLDAETKQKYTDELKKLFLSSELVYTGGIGNTNGEVDVRLNKHGWTFICGKNQKSIITLYKVDLGVGDDDLNQLYVTKSLDLIHNLIDEKKKVEDAIETNKLSYMEEVEINNRTLKELKKQIDDLTRRNEALNDLLKTEDAKVYQSKVNLRNALQNYMVKDKLKID